MEKKKVVILGAGVTGLSAGYYLSRTGRYHVTILEKMDVIGGVCGSFDHNGCTLDYGAHKIYSVVPGAMDEIKEAMGDGLMEVPKKNRLFLSGKFLDYPLRIGGLLTCLNIKQIMQLGFGFVGTILQGVFTKEKLSSYENYVVRRFGRTAYQLVFEPLADKTWGDPKTLHYDIARTRIPSSGAVELIFKLLGLKKETEHTNAETFFYPRGGYQNFPRALASAILNHGGEIVTRADVSKVENDQGRVTKVIASIAGEEKVFDCDLLISSIPMPEMAELLDARQDPQIMRDVQAMQFRHLILVYLFIDRDKVLDDQWVFFPERDYLFSRIFEQKQLDPSLVPDGKTVICCDFTADSTDDIWASDDQMLARRCIDDLSRIGLIAADDVKDILVKRIRKLYPRYDLDYSARMDRIFQYFQRTSNLILAGRLGMYNYNNADHCFDMGHFISQKLEEDLSPDKITALLRERSKTYKIVD